MSKQLGGILGRATRATPAEPVRIAVALSQSVQKREELLHARVPASVKHDVARRAFERGQTVRTFLLECLNGNGVTVTTDQLKD